MCLLNLVPAIVSLPSIKYKSDNPEMTQIRRSIGGADNIEPEGRVECMSCRQCYTSSR